MSVPFLWHNGRLKPWDQATVHVGAHALHYGSSVFEGLRVYATPQGPAYFRLADHTRRLFESARVYEIEVGYTAADIDAACLELIRANGMGSAYVRPIVFRGAGSLGVLPQADGPVEVAILALPWGAYLGDAAERGADVCVSSWRRPPPGTLPSWAKAGGNYLSSQLIALEARRGGYDEGIALGHEGLLSEGAGENLFLVRKGRLLMSGSATAGLARALARCTTLSSAWSAAVPLAAASGGLLAEGPIVRSSMATKNRRPPMAARITNSPQPGGPWQEPAHAVRQTV